MCSFACSSSSDCNASPSQAGCYGGVCMECQKDDDCGQAFPGALLACVSGVCHECSATNKTICLSSSNAARCDLVSFSCAPCVDDSDCDPQSGYPACQFAGAYQGGCYVCRNDVANLPVVDSECDGTTPVCAVGYPGTCVMCSTALQCSQKNSTIPYCAADGSCVQCRNNAECLLTGASICDDYGFCVQCVEDSDCSHGKICENNHCEHAPKPPTKEETETPGDEPSEEPTSFKKKKKLKPSKKPKPTKKQKPLKPKAHLIDHHKGHNKI